MLTQQLIPKNLACLATSRHGIDVQVRKRLLSDIVRFIAIRETSIVVLED